MHILKRFVWWKVLFWFALGGGVGAAIVKAIGDSGPTLSSRVSELEFVEALNYPTLAGGDKVGNIVLYPNHDGVDLVTFDFTHDGKTSWSYIYGRKPFVTAQQLLNQQEIRDRQEARKKLNGGSAVEYYATIANLKLRRDAVRFDSWKSVTAFLTDIQPKQPAATFKTAWWADKSLQYDLAVPLGALLIGTIFSLAVARRSAEDIAAAELMASASKSTTVAAGPSGPSAEDLARVAELDALMARKLAGDTTDDDADAATAAAGGHSAAASGGPAQIKTLISEAVTAIDDGPKEEKDYKGEYYPTVVRNKPQAFTLVELIAVIGVIGILVAILLPTLMKARRTADAIKCEANLRSIGLGMQMYLQQNQNTFPAAYLYIGHSIANGVQTPTSPAAGYIHWSSYLYGKDNVALSAFTCPSMNHGGLPPTNTTPDNMDAGQVCPSPTVIDQQAPRLAYTVNEALCPRNKFVAPMQGATRVYRFVKVTEVANSSGTILGTEMIDNSNMLSYNDKGTGWIMSHRPIDGFIGDNGDLDLYFLPPGAGFHKATRADIDPDPMSATNSICRLDLVGRNHGRRQGYPDRRLTNFLYVDGHVETKSIYDTLSPFEWGEKFYSLTPNDDMTDGSNDNPPAQGP